MDRENGRLPRVRSLLAVCAHPDDESFGLGAVLHAFAARGTRVSVLCFTRGEASTLGEPALLGEVRAAEMAAAAKLLGVSDTEILDYRDGTLQDVPLRELARAVRTAASQAGAELLVVFDEGGITGHPDHCRATEAALAADPPLPTLGWVVPTDVAEALRAELGARFVGRPDDEIDLVVPVDREAQRRAVSCHASQSVGNPVVWRRLELHGDEEALRWLRRPPTDPTFQGAPRSAGAGEAGGSGASRAGR